MNINLSTAVHTGGDTTADVLTNIEEIYGSTYNDTITAGAASESLIG